VTLAADLRRLGWVTGVSVEHRVAASRLGPDRASRGLGAIASAGIGVLSVARARPTSRMFLR
jgi:hypothetical protein